MMGYDRWAEAVMENLILLPPRGKSGVDSVVVGVSFYGFICKWCSILELNCLFLTKVDWCYLSSGGCSAIAVRGNS